MSNKQSFKNVAIPRPAIRIPIIENFLLHFKPRIIDTTKKTSDISGMLPPIISANIIPNAPNTMESIPCIVSLLPSDSPFASESIVESLVMG